MRSPMHPASYRDERLPRYTSYPTAPHFDAAIGPEDYGRWLAQLPGGLDASLYVHVPFCRSMCWYCGCHTTVALRDGPIADYLDALHDEIDLVAERAGRRLPVRHLHFGGGTPTILCPEQFTALMGRLRRAFDFAADAEIAIEIDPRRVDPAMITALADNGVNRASLGVQSFDPLVQKAINRVQSVEQTAGVVAGLRQAGIASMSLDLIYGLPLQTVASCLDTVEQSLALSPDRISVFGYAHVPGFKKHQRRINEAQLPDGAARQEQAEAIAGRLVAAGYRRIGFDHFPLPGDAMTRALDENRLHRNFQGYTTDACEVLIGLGASAIGRLPQGYVQNDTVLARYAQALAQRRPATAKGYRLSADDRLRAEVIERLMCDLDVDIGAICARHGAPRGRLDDSLLKLAPLAAEGLVTLQGSRIRLHDETRLMARKIASAFDSHLDQAARRFSPAV